ncbi:unnamed protein product [Phaedon cochleariae]|uniref:Proline-rich nuclear receptor coactivator 2 n=1 Tax=Phaedon cochleariae TaxID=80249 RepID=A0A9N9X2E7_PHACE|nr:unnamed protein product [Phaedon cochleariae]
MSQKHPQGSRAARHCSKVSARQEQRSSPHRIESSLPRLNPAMGLSHSPQGHLRSSPRSVPGLVAGHYAGCKFSEPPLPSALPLPPKHWMQTSRSIRLPFHSIATVIDHRDVTQQLKMLLKVQA